MGYDFLVNIVKPTHHVIIQSKRNFSSNLWYINDININIYITEGIRCISASFTQQGSFD